MEQCTGMVMQMYPMVDSPPDIKVLPYFEPRKCLICYRPAYCNNYGALTCDACKMFFRRVVTEKLEYECKTGDSCFLDFTEHSRVFPKCKSCRYQRCVSFGMNFVVREKKKKLMELRLKKDEEMVAVIGGLLYQDSQRSKILGSCFTVKNPSLENMIDRRDLKIYVKTEKEQLRPQDWSFFALYTTVDFLLNLDFMKDLQTAEKLTLLKHSASKCSLFGGAMRTYREKRERMLTVDGQDIYPDEMKKVLKLEEGADEFLNRIRCFVVAKLVEMKLTTEEYILICVILFCNPALFYEPDNCQARSIVAAQQQKYTDTLFQYCLHTYQKNGPTRFIELLALCPIIQKNFEDIQYLTMVFKMAMRGVPIRFKQIVEELV